jgi:uncharacterized protein YndB with AHSA1/START domain
MRAHPGAHPTIAPIEKTIELSAPPEQVWRALTDPDELARWFPDKAEVDLRPGGNGSWAWDKHGKFAVKFEIVDPPHHLAWRWSHDPKVPVDVGITTRVEFTLSRRHDGGTTLRLEETGFTTEKHHTQNVSGWDHELGELVAFLRAEGQGRQ